MKLFDVVRLTSDLPEEGLQAGAEGTPTFLMSTGDGPLKTVTQEELVEALTRG